MNKEKLQQLLAALRLREREAFANWIHLQGQIALAEQLLAEEDKDADSRPAETLP